MYENNALVNVGRSSPLNRGRARHGFKRRSTSKSLSVELLEDRAMLTTTLLPGFGSSSDISFDLSLVGTANLVPGPASNLRLAGFPSSIQAGVAGNVTVTAMDTSGNVAIGYQGTIHFTSSDNQAGLPANYTFTRRR